MVITVLDVHCGPQCASDKISVCVYVCKRYKLRLSDDFKPFPNSVFNPASKKNNAGYEPNYTSRSALELI